jgi:hypothetical protein
VAVPSIFTTGLTTRCGPVMECYVAHDPGRDHLRIVAHLFGQVHGRGGNTFGAEDRNSFVDRLPEDPLAQHRSPRHRSLLIHGIRRVVAVIATVFSMQTQYPAHAVSVRLG